MDRIDLNTLPAHCFIVMTIYFLQSVKPCVLPVLHESLIDSMQFDDECKTFDNDFIKKVHEFVSSNTYKIFFVLTIFFI